MLGPADTVGQDVVPAHTLPSCKRVQTSTHAVLIPCDPCLYVGQDTTGTLKKGNCPRLWGTEGFPEEVRSEPKPKDEYEVTSPQFSQSS